MFKKIKKKHFIYASLLMGIFSLFSFATIAYSAINSTARVSGKAYARVEADARITDFRLASTNNATSSYEEFGKNHVVTEIDLVDSTSSISYYVEITNYGSTDVGIYSISGLPSGVNYSLEDYNLKEKICNENNVCNGFIKKTFEITLTTTGTYAGNIQLNFDIRPFLTISYVGFSNQYLSQFIAGDNVSIDLSKDSPSFIYASGQEDFKYTYNSNILSFNNVWCDVEVGIIDTTNFSYTGDVQTYKVKADGVYQLETWGASGGDCSLSSADDPTKLKMYGGNGGYSTGYTRLYKDDIIYVVVGGEGKGTSTSGANLDGGYNGGGYCVGNSGVNHVYGSGGGATHIASKTGLLQNLYDYQDTIYLVAGGGGGSHNQANNSSSAARYGNGGAGGGLDGIAAKGYGGDGTLYQRTNINGTQNGVSSSFGLGFYSNAGAGGGGGLYGGFSSNSSDGFYSGAGDGGSGYIDGVYNGKTIAGDSLIPTYDSTSTMTGNDGNGYAKISPVAIGDYHLIKFINIEEDLSDYSYVVDGEDLNIIFNNEYYGFTVKNKDGSIYSNYSYDSINKRLNVYDISGDLEISVIRAFNYENYSYSGAQEYITLYFKFYNVSEEHYPITMNYYRKLSSNTDGDYELVYTRTVTENDLGTIYYNDYGTVAYTSYDIKVEFIGNNGYKTTLYDTIGTECFVAGTEVLSENGYVNIEDLQVGDFVYALDLDTNERVLKKVIRKFEGQSDETFEITVNGEKIVATPKHKFYVVDKGWIRAAELEVGDVLNSLNSGKLEITNIKHVKHDNPVNVYNLTVEDLHNYFVSSDQLLVHNVSSSPEPFE